MKSIGTFPFGQPVMDVMQTDQSKKSVFVLGVYASAIHARWTDRNNKTKIQALAVASEPYIFWRGDGADSVIKQINVPTEAGSLLPAEPRFNGPSGIALDDTILSPLGLKRSDVWLCDLVPHSCMNADQKRAIKRAYMSIGAKCGLPAPSVPEVPKQLSDEARRSEILNELQRSEAKIVILLGDQPITWFLKYYDPRWNSLSDFGKKKEEYGQLHEITVGGIKMKILPLAHPRQTAMLGQSSPSWYAKHEEWVAKIAPQLLG